MAGFTVLRDISNTLAELLFRNDKIKENISSDFSRNEITFSSPADIDSKQEKPMLSVFLYQIAENIQLRNSSPETLMPISDRQRAQNPPAILDLFFLFTPYAKEKDDELIMLENVVRIFHDCTVIRGDMLKGQLKESGNNEIRVVPNGLSLDELNKLWGIFPNKPFKLSASYLLTPVRIPSEIITDAVRVKEKTVDFYIVGNKK